MWNYSGTAVAGVQNFQNYDFILPASLRGLNVTGTADFTDPNGGPSSSVTGVRIASGVRAPQKGESISLINAAGGFTGTITNNGATLTGQKGATLDIRFRLDQQANDLYAVVEGAQAAPQIKALSEGFVSGAALVNLGADLIAGTGMSEAVGAASRAGVATNYGLGVFGALSGGWSRYNSGSHVDMSSVSLLTGLSWGKDFDPGRMTLAAFFEYGNSSYNTYNSFSNTASVHGKGTMNHLGGGVLGRMDFVDTGPGHVYTEASLRAGGLHNNYKNGDLRDNMGCKADYDSDSAYYGFHLGAGYLWNITDKASLDLYAKYFWTRVGGDSVRLSTGDPVQFKDVDSSRLRGGARFAYAVNEYVSPYIGAAYEHEFDGKARATTYGYKIDAPKLGGGAGIGEIGLSLKPSQSLPLSFDLGVQGYVGKREGVTGSLQIRYEF